MFGKMFNEKSHVMLKKSVYLMATISVLGWVTLAGADDFVEDFESYEFHAFLDALPNWTTVVFGTANTEVTGGDYFIDDINGSRRLHSPRGPDTLAVINPDVLTLGSGTDLEMSVDIYYNGVAIGNGLIFYYQDQDNFYYVEMIAPNRGDTGLRFIKRVSGSTSTIVEQAPAGLELNTEYRMHVQFKAASNTFDIWLETLSDGNVVHKFEDVADNAFRGGQVGVWAWGSFNGSFDNLTVLGGPSGAAERPSPSDGALIEETWVTLKWWPGDFAVSHDVYLGDNFDDVNDAIKKSEIFRGNQVSTLYVAGFPGFAYPDGLVPGSTYYWRIDEVNDADPNSPWKGPVWSFSIPPKTAYNPDPADGAEFVDPNNVTLSWTPGFGAILHTAYFGDNFDEVDNATGGAPLGSATYDPGPLELEKVYYWRVDEFDAVETHKGDIWSFTTPGAVGNPQPAYDATDVGMNTILSWTPADSAASHQLYFGTDRETVRNADTGSPEYKGSKALDAESHDPGLLEADTTYYWRVDEVDAQGNVSTGPIWIFTTGAFLLIDDFESYTDNDTDGEAIWQTWVDGFGIADNGAQAGYLLPPYAEQAIVQGGSQSMPLLYANEAGVTNSEASLTLTATRDWTQTGVTELSLWFRGGSANAEDPLYVSVSNAAGAPAVVAHDDASAAQMVRWTKWTIPLQAIADQGINLTNVDMIAIGLGTKAGATGSGGSGTVYIDDIRLNQ